MSDVSIGTVSSEVRLNLSNLQNDVSAAKSALETMASSLVSQVEGISQKMTTLAQTAVASEERSAQQAAQRMLQQQQQAAERAARQQQADLARAEAAAKASQERALAAARQVGGQLQAMGTVAIGALTAATKVGADFEQKLVTVANNTTMTTSDIAAMTEAVKSLGRESGADLGQLAEGFMHASNFGFTAAESTKILTEAMKSAVSTGSDVGKTTEILANVMHEFSIPAADAGKAMNVLHLAAAQGNATLEQFVEAGGPAFAMAANLKVGMTETSAAMSALTKHGFTAAEAATQVRNILSHIAEPASKTRDLLQELSKTTGIDLARDFSLAGLQGKGMAGILEDVKTAAGRAHVSVEDLMMKLVPAMRGGIGAMALAGTAAKDFKEELKSLADAMSGKVDPTTEAYNRQQATLTAETNKAKNELVLMAGEIEKALLPVLKPMVQVVKEGAEWFGKLSPEAKDAAVKLGLFAGAAAFVTGTVLKTIGAVAELKTAMMALTGLKVPAIGGAEAVAGAGGLSVGAAGAALAASGIGLGYAMNRTVWSGVKEQQDKAFAENLNALEQNKAFNQKRIDFLNHDIAGLRASLKDYADVPTKAAEINTRLTDELGELGRMSAIRDVVVKHQLPKTTVAKTDNANGAGLFDINKWMADHDVGSGGGGGGGGKSGTDDAKRAIQEVQDKLYALSHSDYETQMRQAWRDLNDEIKAGVPALLARQLYTAQLAKLGRDHAEEAQKAGGTMAQQVAVFQAQRRDAAAKENAALADAFGLLSAKIEAERSDAAAIEMQAAEAQKMYDAQIGDLLGLKQAEQEEFDQTMQHIREEQEAREAAWRARIEQSILAANAEDEERKSTEQYRKDNPEVFKKPKTDLDKMLQGMAANVQTILGGAFEKLFLGDTKNIFGELLKSFEQMLAKMVADALAAGIIRSLFGGGNFVTGFMGSLLGGFDDAGNDRTARHWGFDFASMFTQGMNDHSNSRMAAAAPGASYIGGDTHVHINIHGPVVRHDTDIRELSRQVAREVQNGLVARPGTGGRR